MYRYFVKQGLISICALLLAVSGASLSLAQAMPESDLQQEENTADWMGLWTRIQTIRMDAMKGSLKLDDAVMSRLAPHLIQFDQKKRAIGKERLHLLRELKRLTKEKAEETKLQETLHQIEANHAALEAIKQETHAHLAKYLTASQQAEYILFQRKFNAQLRDLIQKERSKKQ